MRWVRAVPVVAAAAVLVLAGVGYGRFIPIHHVERGRLSQLISAQPGPGFKTKPSSSGEVAASSSPFAAVKAAGKESPKRVGAYSEEWTATTSSSYGESILASLLPSQSDAATTLNEAVSAYQAAKSFTSQKLSSVGAFATPSPPGAHGELYAATPDTEDLAVVTYRVGRVVVVDIVEQSSAASAEAAAKSGAASEGEHLERLGSAFSLTVTNTPVVATILWAGVAVVLAAVIVVAPIAVSRARRRRLAARKEAEARAVRGRGKKIVRHQAPRRR